MNELPFSPDKPWLAPLAGYSDLPFRMLCRGFGAAVCCTEMVSVKGLVYANSGTERLLATCGADSPLVVQLFGSEPELYPDMMDQLLVRGFTHFDLNAGCPVRKVLKSGSGSALLDEPDKLAAIARIMADKAGPGRAGVKIRLGFATGDDAFVGLARRLEDAGTAWITLHPRYGKQMFSGRADWPRLAELKRAVSIPVVGSGDLFTAEDGHACLEQTGIDAIMFARGALYDPFIFARFADLRAGRDPEQPSGERLAQVVRDHIRHTRLYDDTERGFRKIRSIIPRYARGLEGIRALRSGLNRCATWESLEQAAAEIALLKAPDSV